MEQKDSVISGVCPVLVTPINAEGDVDIPALRRVLRFLLEREIGGLWVLGTGSEDMNLTFDERLLVAEVVADEVAGKVPLMMGASFFAFKDTVRFINRILDLNPYCIHVMPYHPLLGLDRIEWLYKECAELSEVPIWMYTSANWCRSIPPQFIERMKGEANIGGVKFSTSNAVHMEKVISLASDDFQVVCAVVRQFLSALTLGVKAITTSEASPFPDQIIDIYKAFVNGDMGLALERQRHFNRTMERLGEGLPSEDNFLKSAEEKFALTLRGLCEPYTTSYYRDLTIHEKKHLEAVFRESGYIN